MIRQYYCWLKEGRVPIEISEMVIRFQSIGFGKFETAEEAEEFLTQRHLQTVAQRNKWTLVKITMEKA